MTEPADTPASPASSDVAPDPIRALAVENAALALRLRSAQIPQHVGMTAAARALANDLPRVLMAQVEADLKSGALAKRWKDAQDQARDPSAGIDVEPQLAAVVMLLAEQTKTAARYLAVRGEEWASDAYRLEGQAGVLETQAERLARAAMPAKAAEENATTGS
jgi:hypothetical protein